jgi:hypothetical protein
VPSPRSAQLPLCTAPAVPLSRDSQRATCSGLRARVSGGGPRTQSGWSPGDAAPPRHTGCCHLRRGVGDSLGQERLSPLKQPRYRASGLASPCTAALATCRRPAAALRTSRTAGGGGHTSLAHSIWHPGHPGGGEAVLGHHGGAPARFATAKGVIRRRGSSNRVAVATVTALRDSGGGMLPVRSCGAPGRGEGGGGKGGSDAPLPLPGTSWSRSGTALAARRVK